MASGRRDLATRTLIVASLVLMFCSLVGEAAAMGGGGGGDGGRGGGGGSGAGGGDRGTTTVIGDPSRDATPANLATPSGPRGTTQVPSSPPKE